MRKKECGGERGVTLLELIISIGLFTTVSFMMSGSIISIFDMNKKSQSLKTVINNFNFTIEDMTRIIRFGNTYYCGETSTLTGPQNCFIASGGQSALSLYSEDGKHIIYKYNGSAIARSDNGGATYTTLTAPDVVIENFKFYVYGAFNNDNEQPRVIVEVKGRVGTKPSIQSSFDIQTTISQRNLDMAP